jgi:hypothetical protein
MRDCGREMRLAGNSGKVIMFGKLHEAIQDGLELL